MDTWTPEYKAWLGSLKVGDKVAVKDLDLDPSRMFLHNRPYGYQLYTVTKITPKRTRIDCFGTSQVSFGVDGCYSTTSSYRSETFWLEPLTGDVSQAMFDDKKWMRNVSAIRNAKRQLEEMVEKVDSVPRDVVERVAETAQSITDELSEPK